MNITPNNYFNQVRNLDFSKLNPTLAESHELVQAVTREGQDWSGYKSNPEIKETIDIYFKKLSKQLQAGQQQNKPVTAKAAIKPKARPTIKKVPARPKPAKKTPAHTPVRAKAKQPARKPDKSTSGKAVSALGEETLLFKRVLNMHGKEKTRQSILLFLNALQRKIVERKIRKTSPNASLIEGIQKWAVNTYNKMGKTIRISIDTKTLERLREVTGSEQVRESVRLLKRYIGMHGKQVDSEKATRLYNAIAQAKKKKKITQADPYFKYVQEVAESLKSYGCHMGTEPLKISATALQGLKGVPGLEGLEPGVSAGEDLHQDTRIISSVDLMGLEFETLGFTGKWLDFMGDPTPGFSVLIYGAPKFGKSYLAVEFAGYLAANHGRVLYLTKEEGIGHTIQDKVREKGVAHPNLLIASGYIPGDLSGYDFIFLDSITKLKLSPDDLLRMKEENPGVSFVYISQVTQDGRARGSKEFEHDVDVIIHVPEKGYAIQNGRFNQGGEMEIFEP